MRDKLLEKAFDTAFYKVGCGVQIPMMSLGAMTDYGIALMKTGIATEDAVKQAVEKYKVGA